MKYIFSSSSKDVEPSGYTQWKQKQIDKYLAQESKINMTEVSDKPLKLSKTKYLLP